MPFSISIPLSRRTTGSGRRRGSGGYLRENPRLTLRLTALSPPCRNHHTQTQDHFLRTKGLVRGAHINVEIVITGVVELVGKLEVDVAEKCRPQRPFHSR